MHSAKNYLCLMTAVCMPALVNQNSTKSGSEVYELEEFCLGFMVSDMFGSSFTTALVKWALFFSSNT